MVKIKNIVFLLLIVFILKVTPIFSQPENSKIEFILQGFKYNISLIKDAQADIKVISKNDVTQQEGKWFYNPGCERASLQKISKSSEKTPEVEYLYNPDIGMTINYEQGKIRDVGIGHTPRIKQKIRQLRAPSFLFLHLWPVGITPEEILEKEKTELVSSSEIIDGKKCSLVHISQFGTQKHKGEVEVNYDDFGYKVWFCPEEGFMPKKIEVYRDGKLILLMGPITIQKFKENIWFPTKVEMTWFHESYPEGKSSGTVKYTDIKINEGIEDEIFTPTFKPGTKIYDTIAGISYVISEKTDSEKQGEEEKK